MLLESWTPENKSSDKILEELEPDDDISIPAQGSEVFCSDHHHALGAITAHENSNSYM